MLSTPKRKTQSKAKKNLNDPEQRLKNLEDTLYHLESRLGQDLSDSLATEQVISELIESKVSQIIKDIKQQHKNEVKLLHDKIEEIEALHQKEVQEFKTADEKLRNQSRSINDRCSKIEKRLKDEENSANQLSKQLFEIKKSLSSLEVKIVSSQADYFTTKERLKVLADRIASNQSTPEGVTECVQVINDNTKSKEIKSLPTAPQDVTLEGKNTYAAAAAAANVIPEIPCSPDSVKPKEDFIPNKPMNTHNNKWDIVYLKDSNQKFLNRNRLFPGKRSLGLRCGNIELVRRVLSKPRFEHPEALLIHVGVNDIKNDKYDAKYIADNLISLAYQANDLFPDTRAFLSEITPRMDGLNEKVIAVNKIIRNAPILNISVISHENLNNGKFYDDYKHVNRASGVAVLAKKHQISF